MLHGAKEMKNFRLGATDGDVGRIKDFLFDDEKWTVRYMVADTGSWLSRHEVLISPVAVERVDIPDSRIDVNLTRERIENSPEIESDRPISRQQERSYYSYYGWPVYWGGTGIWGPHPYPSGIAAETIRSGAVAEQQAKTQEEDSHLRSAREVEGYHLQADDGAIGHVDDFLLDEQSWSVAFLVIDTKNWLPGKHVLIPPRAIGRVSWPDRSVTVGLTRDQVRNAPEYDRSGRVPPGYFDDINSYYGTQFSLR